MESIGKENAEHNSSVEYAASVEALTNMSKKCSGVIDDRNSVSDYVTLTELDELGKQPQMDRKKTMRIVEIVHTFVNKNDLLGIAFEAIENNINTKFRVSFAKECKKSDEKTLKKAKEVIAEFNKQINIPYIIEQSIATTFLDGTYIQYLRGNREDGYFVDNYPLTVCEILPYERSGTPLVQFDIAALQKKLGMRYARSRQGRLSFAKDFDEELKNVYPEEVYKAYKDQKKEAILDLERIGVMRINNQRMSYGLSPVFRSISPIVMLDTFENSDKSTAMARSKKILVQYMNKEIMGTEYERLRLEEQRYAHNTLTSAWREKIVVLTPPPTVREIAYVEPDMELIPIETVQLYRSKAMTTLGIGFYNDTGSKSLTTANLSVKQLIKMINRIARQLEPIVERWYKKRLIDEGIDPSFAPRFTVGDAEEMDFAMRQSLASLLYTTFNCSLDTTLKLLGVDLEDEKKKRMEENSQKLTDVFAPYKSIYTNSGDSNPSDNKGGRPESNEDEGKQQYDKEKNAEK